MSILFIGGDKRQNAAMNVLVQNKIKVISVFEDIVFDENLKNKIASSRAIVLPLPVSNDGITLNASQSNTTKLKLADILSHISSEALIIGGKFAPSVKSELKERRIKYIDYYENEDFQIKNALLSAEGAVFTAMNISQRSLFSSKIAVIGFGRIGKLLASKLNALGAEVTVCARKSADVAWSEILGYQQLQITYSDGISSLSQLSDKYDIIFNTVPSWIFDEHAVSRIGKETVFIDLASSPFGIDERLVEKFNINYLRASGIPGKYAPVSAGEIIGRSVMQILEKEGIIL